MDGNADAADVCVTNHYRRIGDADKPWPRLAVLITSCRPWIRKCRHCATADCNGVAEDETSVCQRCQNRAGNIGDANQPAGNAATIGDGGDRSPIVNAIIRQAADDRASSAGQGSNCGTRAIHEAIRPAADRAGICDPGDDVAGIEKARSLSSPCAS